MKDAPTFTAPHLRMRSAFRLAAAVTALAAPLVVGAQVVSAPAVKPLQYSRLVLPNGLVALFNEDHSSPIVGVQVTYLFGAKDERSGGTGLAHLCEHMMFEGSASVAPGD